MRRILESALRLAVPHLTEVLHAANGVQGLAVLEDLLAANQQLNLILCDMNMPRMDGLDFLLQKQQRSLAPSVPLLMVTADPGSPRLLQALVSGAQGFLTKPFTLRQIQAHVVSLLRPDGKTISPQP